MQTNKVTNVFLALILLAVVIFIIVFFTQRGKLESVKQDVTVEDVNANNNQSPVVSQEQPPSQTQNQSSIKSYTNQNTGVTFSYPKDAVLLALGTKTSTPFLSTWGTEELYVWYPSLTAQDVVMYNQRATAGVYFEEPRYGAIVLAKTLGSADENMERPTFTTEYIGKDHIQAKVIGKNDPVNETVLADGQKYYSAHVVYYFGHWTLTWNYGGNSRIELEKQRDTLAEIVATIDGI